MQKQISSLFSHLLGQSIQTRILSSFLVLLAFIIIVAVIGSSSLVQSKSSINNLVKVDSALLVSALELDSLLNQSQANLGFYVSTKDEIYKKTYQDAVTRINSYLEDLKNNEHANQGRVKAIETNLNEVKNLVLKIYEYTDSQTSNEPGLSYAAEHFNSTSQQILQLLSQAISSEQSETATAERRQLFHRLHLARYTWANVMNGLRGFLSSRSDRNRQEVVNYLEQFDKVMGEIAEYSSNFTFEQEEAIQLIDEKREGMLDKFKRLDEIHTGEQGRMDAYLISKHLSNASKRLNESIQGFISDRQAQTQESSDTVQVVINSSIGAMIVLAIVAVVIALIVYTLMRLTIVRPLKDIVDAMRDIAQGDGDLTKRMAVKGKDELGKLAEGFNHFVARIQTMLIEVRALTMELKQSSTLLSDVTTENKESVERQYHETDQVASAVTELSSTAKAVSDSARTAAEYAMSSNERAEESATTVNQTLTDIQSIARFLEDSTVSMEKLNSDSVKVSQILQVINEIAEQTNLLALNAAIEAARAGEQGRGFAVVADEVRSLATRTQSSAEEIYDLIGSLQKTTSSTVDEFKKSNELASSTAQNAQKAQEALSAITRDLSQINTMNTEIAYSSTQQVDVSEEITGNVIRINDISEDVLKRTNSLAEVSNQLSRVTGSIESGLEQFTI